MKLINGSKEVVKFHKKRKVPVIKLLRALSLVGTFLATSLYHKQQSQWQQASDGPSDTGYH